MGKLARALLPVLLSLPAAAQNFTQRGFLASSLSLYPDTAPNDSSHAIDDSLFRYEASYKAASWLRLSGSFDASCLVARSSSRLLVIRLRADPIDDARAECAAFTGASDERARGRLYTHATRDTRQHMTHVATHF